MKIKGKISRIAAVCMMVAASLLAPVTAMAEEIFARLADMPGVESTFVSGRYSRNNYISAMDEGRNVPAQFLAMYTYDCNSQQSVKQACEILKEYQKKHPNFQLMMRTKDSEGLSEIYEEYEEPARLKLRIFFDMESPSKCEITVMEW